ncbi:hypothetical protein [Falsigemmobacter faecalis]|uniref:Uncharacterized protein n=1 Tax=Falsigemmobacter faecalis TaxID=2488730 RepID=A0A3P3DRT3_9RHOB|nr:hypothetical protein [Falsigemmobacter faecalis]RRH76970.1 hypothetical protein EG244_05045 [Falsigemmobacter faecalis]
MSERLSVSRAASDAAPQVSPAELLALGLGLLWLAGGLGFAFLGGESALRGLSLISLVVLPALLFAGAGFALNRMRHLKEEARSLRESLESLRQERATRTQASAAAIRPASAAVTARATARAPGASARPLPASRSQPEDQSSLAFEMQPASPPLQPEEFIRALNFPDGPQDAEGIRCLRLALEDRDAARMIRSAQDVLTLLAQDGIYMDDLHPEPAPAELWRRFGGGERGASAAGIGGIHDRSSLALTGARMRSDAVFRDAAHHFLRQYDRSLQMFSKDGSDIDLLALAETRTSRAFMLLGRVAGVFD